MARGWVARVRGWQAGVHLGQGRPGISPSSLHSGIVRRARARRAAAQLQASCPLSAASQSELIAPTLAPSSRHLRAQWSEVRVSVRVRGQEWR